MPGLCGPGPVWRVDDASLQESPSEEDQRNRGLKLLEKVKSLGRPVAVLGDWNQTPDEELATQLRALDMITMRGCPLR